MGFHFTQYYLQGERMKVLEGHEIIGVKDNHYLPEAAKAAIRGLLFYTLGETTTAEGYYERINALLKATPGFDHIPTEDRLAHMIMQMEAPGQGLPGAIADGLDGVVRPQPSESDIRDLIIKDLNFGKVYFSEDGFFGLTLGNYVLALQVGEPSGKPGYFFLRVRQGEWKGYIPRVPLAADRLTAQTFNGYLASPPGTLGREFTSYIDSRL